MDKETLLRSIADLAAQKLISKEEVLKAFGDAGCKEQPASARAAQTRSMGEIVSYIGGGIVVMGIAIFIGQHWSELATATRILATLGSGIAAFTLGVIFSRSERFNLLSQVFFFISALTMPAGLSITFDSAGWDMGSTLTHTMLSGTLFCVYGAAYWLFKKGVFNIFNIIFGTWFFFSFTDALITKSTQTLSYKFDEYRVLAVGLSYVLIGYHFSRVRKHVLSKWLYALGVIGFLGAALALGGWDPKQNFFWELLFPGLCFGVVYLSIYLRSKIFLVFGALYLIGYFLKITGEYFAKSLGWPLALIILGFVLIFIGYFSFYFNKKYLSEA